MTTRVLALLLFWFLTPQTLLAQAPSRQLVTVRLYVDLD